MSVRTPFLRTVRCDKKGHIFECSQEELDAMEDADFSLRTALLIARNERKLPEVSWEHCPECQRNRVRWYRGRAKKAAAQ